MAVEIALRAKYRTAGSAKKTKGKASGNGAMGGAQNAKNPPRGIRRRPRRRYGA